MLGDLDKYFSHTSVWASSEKFSFVNERRMSYSRVQDFNKQWRIWSYEYCKRGNIRGALIFVHFAHKSVFMNIKTNEYIMHEEYVPRWSLKLLTRC